MSYSERGTKTKQEEILKAIKNLSRAKSRGKGIMITEEQLERAFRVFEKQSEVDFFINKNAKAFLQEQFKLWSYQYFCERRASWTSKYKPVAVIHYEIFATRDEAIEKEKWLKTGFGRKWIKRELKAGKLNKRDAKAARQAGTKDLDYKLIKPLIWWE